MTSVKSQKSLLQRHKKLHPSDVCSIVSSLLGNTSVDTSQIAPSSKSVKNIKKKSLSSNKLLDNKKDFNIIVEKNIDKDDKISEASYKDDGNSSVTSSRFGSGGFLSRIKSARGNTLNKSAIEHKLLTELARKSQKSSSKKKLPKIEVVSSINQNDGQSTKVKRAVNDGNKKKATLDDEEDDEDKKQIIRTTAQAQGLKLLHKLMRNNAHMRPLPHTENRPDYEFQLRQIATSGVVQLFNSLKAAQRAEQSQLAAADEGLMTLDKARDKSLVASKEAFLDALRSQSKVDF